MNDDLVGTGYELTEDPTNEGLTFGPYGPFALTEKFKVLRESEAYGDKLIELRVVVGMKWHEVRNTTTGDLEGLFLDEGITVEDILPELRKKYGLHIKVFERW